MLTIHSFKPVARADARTLILGSMPGQASLDAVQYYAHPRNSFWRIIAAVYSRNGAKAALPPYKARLELLLRNRVALWDVLASCVRPGSADSDIGSPGANDFNLFFKSHPAIELVLFNGAKALECYKKYVLPGLPEGFAPRLVLLPSTSPANAALPEAGKLALWRAALCGPAARPRTGGKVTRP